MNFKVITRFGGTTLKSTAYLTWDDWNDYSFYTLYGLVYVDESRVRHEIGGIKIAFVGQKEGDRSLSRSQTFTELADNYFSLGTSDEYYENLNKFGFIIRDQILEKLRDIAKSPDIYNMAIEEKVTHTSLFRSLSPSTVTGQFRRICNGGARLTEYRFKFSSPPGTGVAEYELSFEVLPESSPPTNIHVLIGRNGVGKTHLINNMIDSLISTGNNSKQFGQFATDELPDNQALFVNLVSVTFSAFDETEPKPEQIDKTKGILYFYIGLKRLQIRNEQKAVPKSTTILKNEFLKSLNACKIAPKYEQWKDAITMLESDTNFKDSEVKDLIDLSSDSEEFKEMGSNVFRRLSSGHKIVLLTITRLIETVQERTLILIDEPEAHLHPPLLAAFIRAISELLLKTNGVAIIATHSPVILQEVPKSCVWKLRRSGVEIVVERPVIETFGENVGILTSDVFGLEVTKAGFYKMLEDVVKGNRTYDEILSEFNNQLGMEARALLGALIATKSSN
jgi:ABC-type molybdenum transport system ATPase subunit/photorepair protein PhrA